MDPIIQRINELYHKSQNEGLTDEERQEQKELRLKYVALFRGNLQATLDNTYIVDENGNKVKVTKKTK